MKTIATIITLFIFSFIVTPVNANLFEDGIDKATKLVTIERYDAAHHLIETEIIKDPENAENFYRAGQLYLRMGWTSQADRSFDFATMLDKKGKLKIKIAKIYQVRGLVAVNDGRVKSARKHLAKAHNLNPLLKNKDTHDLLNYGREYLGRGQAKKAYVNFLVAYNLDSRLGNEISDAYYDICENIKQPCFAYYRRCQEFSDKNNIKIVTLLTSLYHTPGINEQHKRTIKNEVKQYVSQAEFKRLFPPLSTKIYLPGTYTIHLKAGETTNYWIAFRDGKKYDYNISSKDDRFITTFYDGRSFNTWEITRFPYTRHVKIKLTAVTDQVITLTLK